jgi:hypothetical protein
MDILSISFSMVFMIMSNFSFKNHDINGCEYTYGLISPWLNLDFIFSDSIMFTSTLTTLLIIASRLVDLISLNNREKSLSKE